MSVTRTALCNWRDTQGRRCPYRDDPFEHVCYHCGAAEVEHCHVGDRGMGGRKGDIPIVLLCHHAHEQVTLNYWRDSVYEMKGRRFYLLFDVASGKVLVEREIGGDADAGTALNVADSTDIISGGEGVLSNQGGFTLPDAAPSLPETDSEAGCACPQTPASLSETLPEGTSSEGLSGSDASIAGADERSRVTSTTVDSLQGSAMTSAPAKSTNTKQRREVTHD